MNLNAKLVLGALRKLYALTVGIEKKQKLVCEENPDKVSEIMYEQLTGQQPAMIARLGSTELETVANYLGIVAKDRNILRYISGKQSQWWWNANIVNQIEQWSGFFPTTKDNLERFCELMLEDSKEVDILGSWLANERLIFKKPDTVVFVQREIQNPFFTNTPWTRALAGKTVLVVHPFAALIDHQYTTKREKLFKNSDILPHFTLKTIQAVQSLGGESDQFKNWFEALEWMKNEIDKTEYDICLIGCGAYGFPLAAHVKRQGKKSVHLGGSLQLLFGIKGKRWENPDYNAKYNYAELINEHWVRPGDSFKPKNANEVEGGCYW